MVGHLTTTLLQIVNSMCRWKNFENQLIFGEDTKNYRVGRFLGHSVDSWWWFTTTNAANAVGA